MGKKVDIWSNPSGTKDAKLIASLSEGVSPQIEIEREVKVANSKIWYQVELFNQIDGWVESDKIEVLYSSDNQTPLRDKTAFLSNHMTSKFIFDSGRINEPATLANSTETERHNQVMSLITLVASANFAKAL
ncbi:GW dipeptide domain-containing protein [Listeria fleischmannii]|uniref:GW dipeptide domain-containing protein n=1 Tax=Listeria fleischmannii TaxID=1069827 RepID=UPI0004BCAFDD|nr:GW dipeptide domain-containing protein [Listeria fleischmannii]